MGPNAITVKHIRNTSFPSLFLFCCHWGIFIAVLPVWFRHSCFFSFQVDFALHGRFLQKHWGVYSIKLAITIATDYGSCPCTYIYIYIYIIYIYIYIWTFHIYICMYIYICLYISIERENTTINGVPIPVQWRNFVPSMGGPRHFWTDCGARRMNKCISNLVRMSLFIRGTFSSFVVIL